MSLYLDRTAQHSLFSSISHILLSHKGLRKTCNLQTAGRCLSVCYPYFPLTSLSDNIMRGPYDYRLILKRMY